MARRRWPSTSLTLARVGGGAGAGAPASSGAHAVLLTAHCSRMGTTETAPLPLFGGLHLCRQQCLPEVPRHGVPAHAPLAAQEDTNSAFRPVNAPAPPPFPADPRRQKKKRKQSKAELLEAAQAKQAAAEQLAATQDGKVRGALCATAGACPGLAGGQLWRLAGRAVCAAPAAGFRDAGGVAFCVCIPFSLAVLF